MKRPRDFEDWILICCAVILITIAALFISSLVGCSSQKVMHLDLLCVGPDGEVFHANGVTAAQAGKIENNWDFHSCDVEIEGSQGATKKQPPKD